jgi:hypothetical protein
MSNHSIRRYKASRPSCVGTDRNVLQAMSLWCQHRRRASQNERRFVVSCCDRGHLYKERHTPPRTALYCRRLVARPRRRYSYAAGARLGRRVACILFTTTQRRNFEVPPLNSDHLKKKPLVHMYGGINVPRLPFVPYSWLTGTGFVIIIYYSPACRLFL